MAGILSSGTTMTSLVSCLYLWSIKNIEKIAKAYAILLHLMRGTPIFTKWEEIGMTNFKFGNAGPSRGY